MAACRSADHILALDVGTSSTKAVVFDPQGRRCAFARVAYRNDIDASGRCEQNPARWWQAVKTSVLRIVPQIEPEKIRAITITTLRAAVLAVDLDGKPLAPAVLAHDLRAAGKEQELLERFGDRVYRKTGLRCSDYFSLPRMLWLRARIPEAGGSTRWLGAQDYLVHKLCGEYVTDFSQAGRTLLLNAADLRWDPELLDYARIDAASLPRLVPAGTVVGKVRPRVASKLGIPALDVVLGGGDQACASLGLAGIRNDIVTANHGSGCFVLTARMEPVLDPQQRFLCSPHAWAGHWACEAAMLSTGRQLEEWKRLVGISEHDLRDLDRLSPPGSHGVICVPHMAGATAPYWRRDARGAFLGLRIGQSKQDILRALVEGLLFDLAENLDIIGQPRELRVAGGLAQVDAINQMQADICGLPVVRATETGATALGAAIVGAAATGVHPDIQSASAAMVQLDEASRRLPDPQVHLFYSEARRRYERLVRLVHDQTTVAIEGSIRDGRNRYF